MKKALLIHANCRNSQARGDFAFAGNVAKDLARELHNNSITDIDIVLVSTLDGVGRFEKLYGPAVNGQIEIEGTSVYLSSLEEFDAVENSVLAFIDANRCKHSPAALVKRILSPDSKFLFVGNINQQDYSELFLQAAYRVHLKDVQPGLYDFFDEQDMLIGSAGLGPDRLGLPMITSAGKLPDLTDSQKGMLPTGDYGFMYAAADSFKEYKLLAQYMKLTDMDKYVLVGDFSGDEFRIKLAYEMDTTLTSSRKHLPQIDYYQSLPNGVMRRTVANTKGDLVLSTGTTSTLEVMQDNKLPYYQYLSVNENFVVAYLIAVKSIVSNNHSLFGTMPQLIIELSEVLFAMKPLSRIQMERANDLLQMSCVSTKLLDTNQAILEQAKGKIAPRLLGFLNTQRSTQDNFQLATVCASLRKPGEKGTPVHDKALRRAASWGRLFELKVIIRSMSLDDINKQDLNFNNTALHWAVIGGNLDCARLLVKAGASLDIQDNEGKTPLHRAVSNGNREMIKMLVEAGASIDLYDNDNRCAHDSAPDMDTLLFIRHCQSISKNHQVIDLPPTLY